MVLKLEAADAQCQKPNVSFARIVFIFQLAYFLFAVCPVPSVFAMGGNSGSSSSSPASLTFGSQVILENCWSAAELRGSNDDKKVVRSSVQTYHDPPDRTMPKKVNDSIGVELENSIRHVNPIGNRKIIALTFDLCECRNEISGYDADILNYLRENKVKATFFAGGKWMHSHPEKTMQLMADPLFEIGNHSWTHGNFRMMDNRQMEEQILWTQAQYELIWEELQARARQQRIYPSEMKKIPSVPSLFRFPYGTCNSQALNMLKEYGLRAIQWDVVTGDAARGQTPQAIARIILTQVKPGSIIICHANGRGHGTYEALHLFIPKLRAMNYDFLTVSELLTYGPAVTSKDCYELRPGDNLRYDKRVGLGSK